MLNKLLVPAQTQDSIRFVVSPTGTRVVTLQDFTAPYAAVVDWGDGAQDAIVADTPVSHTYADNTPREVRITGALGGFWNATTRPGGTTMVTAVREISSQSLVSLNETFRQCTSLTTVPAVITAPNLTSCVRTFYQCKSITSDFPALWLTHAQATHTSAFTQSFLSMYGHYGTSCPNRQYVAAVAKQTYYDKYGTGCSAATYHAAVAQKTYAQYYGVSNCPNRTLIPEVPRLTYWEKYGTSCPSLTAFSLRPQIERRACSSCGYEQPVAFTALAGEKGFCPYGVVGKMYLPASWFCNSCGAVNIISESVSREQTMCPGDGCTRIYQNYVAAYSQCKSGTSISRCAGTSCTKIYIGYSPAYYSCGQSSLSGTTTCDSTCARVYQSGQSAYYKCKKSNSTCQTNSCPYAYANQASVDAARAAGWL